MYSHKNFTQQSLIDRTDMDGQYIRSSCFSQEQPDTEVFPPTMRGVTFVNCNLENCIIPEGNTVIDCETRRYSIQNDLNDWEIDEDGRPLTVTNYLYFYKNGLSFPNPANIPDAPLDERVKYEAGETL